MPADAEKTEEKVGEADRERYAREVLFLAQRLDARGADLGDTVWEVYAATEKLIAVLKFRLDYETPGVFAKLPDADEPQSLLGDAGALLSNAATELREGALVRSIETLRAARNNLRSYLREERRSAGSAAVGGRKPRPRRASRRS